MFNIKTLVTAMSLSAIALTSAVSANAAEITGAGSSFAAPIYTKWAAAYQEKTGVKLNYQSIGSGAGLKQIAAKTVDFGASDKPLKPEELKEKGMIQFPTVVGGVVPVVNLPGIKPGEMKLTGDILAKIYMGKITKWNDKEIADINPGVNLPDTAIGAVRRADGSGTTFIFTNYLSKVSNDWKDSVGVGTAVKWPVGLGGKGNEGVSAFVQRIPGAIGYVEYAYAQENGLTYTQLSNKDGNFVKPTNEAFQSAAKYADWSHGFYEILTNEPGAKSWPITGATFVVMHAKQDNAMRGSEVLKFFRWSYKNGDDMAVKLSYVPLPDATVKMIEKSWSNIHADNGKVVASK